MNGIHSCVSIFFAIVNYSFTLSQRNAKTYYIYETSLQFEATHPPVIPLLTSSPPPTAGWERGGGDGVGRWSSGRPLPVDLTTSMLSALSSPPPALRQRRRRSAGSPPQPEPEPEPEPPSGSSDVMQSCGDVTDSGESDAARQTARRRHSSDGGISGVSTISSRSMPEWAPLPVPGTTGLGQRNTTYSGTERVERAPERSERGRENMGRTERPPFGAERGQTVDRGQQGNWGTRARLGAAERASEQSPMPGQYKTSQGAEATAQSGAGRATSGDPDGRRHRPHKTRPAGSQEGPRRQQRQQRRQRDRQAPDQDSPYLATSTPYLEGQNKEILRQEMGYEERVEHQVSTSQSRRGHSKRHQKKLIYPETPHQENTRNPSDTPYQENFVHNAATHPHLETPAWDSNQAHTTERRPTPALTGSVRYLLEHTPTPQAAAAGRSVTSLAAVTSSGTERQPAVDRGEGKADLEREKVTVTFG